jgi:hypothetical protein
LESDPPESVTPRTAAVTLRGNQVTLDLAVRPTANADALLLNGPRFGWLGAAERYPDRHFPELKIRVNGELIAPQDRFETVAGGNNVTSLVRAADMDPWAITRTPPVTAAHPQSPQVINVLRNAGAIAKAGDDDGLYTAKWLARRLLAIPLAPSTDATLQLEYDARPGIRSLSADSPTPSSFARLYCLPEKVLQQLVDKNKSPIAADEYQIATGVDGNPPDAVTLSWSASPEAAQPQPSTAFWCGPGGKSLSKRGRAERERAAADTSGVVHVLVIGQ